MTERDERVFVFERTFLNQFVEQQLWGRQSVRQEREGERSVLLGWSWR